MKIHEASLSYRVVAQGQHEPLDNPEKVAAYMKGAFDADPTVEWFYAIVLNTRNKPLARIVISRGIATATMVHPREVFKAAILAGATAIIVVHNHPSGDCQPSQADIQITRQLRDAGKVLGIPVHDHVILGDSCFFSFEEAGLL